MIRCALCPRVNQCLPADGPRGTLLFIGEAPGKEENKKGRVFIGKTGDEVNQHYLPLAGLLRERVRFINAIACLPTSTSGKLDLKREKDRRMLQCCSDTHLNQEIASSQSLKLLVPMGAFACHAIDPDLHLEIQHGFPVMTRWGIPAFPMYHPALGIHEPKKMLMIRTDWMRLKQYLAGKHVSPIDELETDYAEVTDPKEIDSLDPTRPLAGDTESSRSLGPYCLTYSQQPGTGRLIRATRDDLLSRLRRRLSAWRAPLLFHNWLYDRKVVLEMGIHFPDHLIRDTMLMAFHLGNLPQGLKALGWRELGMEMQDFLDLVTPHSAEMVLHYYRMAELREWGKPEQRMEFDEKSGLWKLKKPQGMNTKLKRFFTDYGKNPEKDVFQMWEKNWVEEQETMEAELGPWPGLDIAHVPFDQVIHYACRDPDATLRLYPILRAMQRLVRRQPQERWRARSAA